MVNFLPSLLTLTSAGTAFEADFEPRQRRIALVAYLSVTSLPFLSSTLLLNSIVGFAYTETPVSLSEGVNSII